MFDPESDDADTLAAEYGEALACYLRDGTKTPRANAYTIGRRAGAIGLSPGWLIVQHRRLLEEFFAQAAQADEDLGDHEILRVRGYEMLSELMSALDLELTRLRNIASSTRNLVEHYHVQAADLTTSQRLRVEAEANAQARSAFLARVSHEIRTPMNGITGMVSLLLESRLDDEQQEHARIIHLCSEHLLSVIDDVLDFSKSEAGGITLDLKPVWLGSFIRDTLGLVAERASSRGVSLRCTIDDDAPPAIMADAARLRQVLLNLLSNAIKFTHEGEVVLTVRTQARRRHMAHLHFSVRDTGIGIEPEVQARLFQPFEQGRAGVSSEFGGTGLGLAISKGLVELMDGQVWVESQAGEGSTFHFTILTEVPEGIDEEDAPRARVARELTGALDQHMARRHPLQILVADDNVINQRVLAKLLSRLGYEADVVSSGAEVLAALEERRYDLVLMDVQMPDMDGLAATRAIIDRFGGTRPRIVAVTASVLEDERAACQRAGMDGFLSKPCTLTQLAHTLREASPAERDEGARG